MVTAHRILHASTTTLHIYYHYASYKRQYYHQTSYRTHTIGTTPPTTYTTTITPPTPLLHNHCLLSVPQFLLSHTLPPATSYQTHCGYYNSHTKPLPCCTFYHMNTPNYHSRWLPHTLSTTHATNTINTSYHTLQPPFLLPQMHTTIHLTPHTAITIIVPTMHTLPTYVLPCKTLSLYIEVNLLS